MQLNQLPMPPPNDALAFSSEFHLVAPPHHELALSDKLADLLSVAREQYKWKAETTKESQEGSMELENETARRLTNLDEEDARWIAQEVSRWGGNNVRAIQTIASWSSEQSRKVADLINQLLTSASIRYAMCQLTKQPGLGLVIASKIYRFCCPQAGAAVDRHSSYFFNSLPILDETGRLRACTGFKREWANGKHRTSRLAIYTDSNCDANLNEFCASYVPLLKEVAEALNSKRGGFFCAASGTRRPWRPTDVEMAAYFWWSRNMGQYR